jgi:hypothetical protein
MISQLRISVRSLKGQCHEFEDSYNGIQVIDLKNLGLPEHNFYSLLMPFSCFNSKKAFCGGFSFDSNSANDE